MTWFDFLFIPNPFYIYNIIKRAYLENEAFKADSSFDAILYVKKIKEYKMTGNGEEKTTNLVKFGGTEMELLAVIVDEQTFGINVTKVQSIQQYDPKLVTSLPEAHFGVAGMFLYRNKTIPLMDLSLILGIEPTQAYDQEIIVVTEFNNAVNSFKVQGVKRIYRLSWEELIPMDQIFDGGSCFTGSVHVEGTQILVIDIEHILADIFPDMILEEISHEVLAQGETIHRENLEILFAEDSLTMRKRVTATLNNAGFSNITGFQNGHHALESIQANFRDRSPEQIARTVLITDIEMPKMDGLTLCSKIKQDPLLNGIHVVMFSSLINDQMIEKCHAVLADNYVTKPEITRLVKILDKRCFSD
jgi:two-component system chemotaxis response regulator CheV